MQVVEPYCYLSSKFQMLALVMTHGDMSRSVNENIRRLQDRV